MAEPIRPEDYKEPACPFCSDFYRPQEKKVIPIDLRRFTETLDRHLGRNDLAAAERHLRFWRTEALAGNDEGGLLAVENERMGFYRKAGRKSEAMEALHSALDLVDKLGLEGTVTAATTWLNAATVHKTFGQADQALPLYERARAVYEASLAPDDPRMGGLYNNMALALTDLGRYDEARALYGQALEIMKAAPHGALEQAITCLNLANLAEAEQGLLEAEGEIDALLNRAWALLQDEALCQDGYYAFVCEKCAPTFRYYGRFADAEALEKGAEVIYAGN